MKILKKIARKILADEIKEIKEECDRTKSRNNELLDNMDAFKEECESKKRVAENKAEELEKENKILRKHYDLDKEPSEEIKAKIHIDLEINRMREEMMKVLVMHSRQPIYYMSPLYPFGRIF